MPFTPLHTLLGGYLLHLSTSTLLVDTGRVLGISGITESGIFDTHSKWQRVILSGLVLGPTVAWSLGLDAGYAGDALAGWSKLSIARASLGGLLVGFGSRLGSGCTSGHFLCGVSRGSKRSLVATATFFSAALITANLTSFPFPAPITAQPGYIPTYTTKSQSSPLLWSMAGLNLAQILIRLYSSRTQTPSTLQRYLPYFWSGLTFSLGLLFSGMADPAKVLSFLIPLDLHNFDPSLAMVVLSGVIPNALHWWNTPKGKVTYPWEKWSVPSRKDIDARLLVGAAIFGIGWGVAGVCPGPALVGVGRLFSGFLAGEQVLGVSQIIGSYMISMVGGMALVKLI